MSFLIGALLFGAHLRAGAVPVTVDWPDGAVGGYKVTGIMPTATTQSGTYEIAEGTKTSLVGTGINVDFTIKEGKVDLPYYFATNNPGVLFDPATHTFSFKTVDVQVVANNFSGNIGIDTAPAAISGASGTSYKLVVGRHQLMDGREPVSFDVEEDGFVRLLGDINGLTSRGSVITLNGTRFNAPPPAVDPQQQKADQDLHDRILAASEQAAWKADFNLVEKMDLWDFSEQQIHYPVKLPATVNPAGLTLLAFTDSTVRAVPFQLSSASGSNPVIYFRTDLPKGARRLFRLVPGFDAKGIPVSALQPPALQTTSNPQEALLGNGLLFLKVPAGHRDFAGGEPLAHVPAPILGAARQAQPPTWLAAESFAAPDLLKVKSMDAKLVESGLLFATYQVAYQLENGKSYTTTLELRAGESHVLISEALSGFTPDDQAFLQLDYGRGLLDPDRRLVPGPNPYLGYYRYSGAYDRNVSTDDHSRPWPSSARWLDYDPKLDDSKVPRLDFRLGIYIPNNLGVLQAATFYPENGNDAVLLAIDRPAEWKTYTRALWDDYRSVDNLRFYSQDGRKYMETGLAGAARYWTFGLIPREDVVLRAIDKAFAGPEVWLATELGVWNLQAEKDRSVDWDEKLDTPVPADAAMENRTPPASIAPLTYDDYAKKYLDGEGVRQISNFASFFGYMSGRCYTSYYADYVRSRNNWTPEQRERVRQILVFFTDYAEGDLYMPSHSMLAGHPNFLMDVKQSVASGLATFPNHPEAKAWRDSYLSCYNEFLDRYERKDVPELNTRGGRWTESIACYWGQSMTGLLNSQLALESYDGTTLAENPRIFDTIRWMRDVMMSPENGQRMVPPQGAHSFSFLPGEAFWKSFFQFCQALAPGNPSLAQEMRWIETHGREGTKPDVRSVLYTDYGPVFHYDFGGSHESYAHMQDINGMSYRWGFAGIVYYGAKNKIWSYNGPESDGDEFDWEKLTAMTVNGNGLSVGPTDQLLYDFGFAQFYRQPGKEGDDYRARALMLLRDDYLVISDEMKSPDVPAVFRWVNLYDMPEIDQLKPGAPMVESTFEDSVRLHPGETARIFKRRVYSGQGDFLTVVAPGPVQAAATPFGATVNGEYVFASQKPETIAQGPAVFSGSYGYARPNQLALFQGDKIGLGGFTLQRDGGDFGVSAAAEGGKITGCVVGRSGGKISIVPPAGFDVSKASVTFDGQPVPHASEQGAVVFAIEIAQKDGNKNYAITF